MDSKINFIGSTDTLVLMGHFEGKQIVLETIQHVWETPADFVKNSGLDDFSTALRIRQDRDERGNLVGFETDDVTEELAVEWLRGWDGHGQAPDFVKRSDAYAKLTGIEDDGTYTQRSHGTYRVHDGRVA